jgi:hypothetical protein
MYPLDLKVVVITVLAQVAVPHDLFRRMLQMIDALRVPSDVCLDLVLRAISMEFSFGRNLASRSSGGNMSGIAEA